MDSVVSSDAVRISCNASFRGLARHRSSPRWQLPIRVLLQRELLRAECRCAPSHSPPRLVSVALLLQRQLLRGERCQRAACNATQRQLPEWVLLEWELLRGFPLKGWTRTDYRFNRIFHFSICQICNCHFLCRLRVLELYG